MFGASLTLRGIGILLGLVAFIFGCVALYNGLAAQFGETTAAAVIALVALVVAGALWAIAEVQHRRRRTRTFAMVERILDDSPVAGVAAAALAGAAARFGVEADEVLAWVEALWRSRREHKHEN